jgi:glyoxylase I family protein
MTLTKIHHIAIICSDYKKSKKFYVQDLGLEPLQEIYRKERQSYKLDLALNGEYIIELFSFPNPPPRSTRPEATGLRHLAFQVDDLEYHLRLLAEKGINAEPIRTDELTQKKFTFILDPDHLPIELYQK